jgi:predicted ArsR family transcriptional regulator
MNPTSSGCTEPRTLDRHKALSHPLRRVILSYLVDNSSGSPSQMAEKMDAELSDISYHCKQLVKYGAADLAEERPTRRGSPEHVYVPTVRALLTNEEVEKMSASERQEFAGQCAELVSEDLRKGFSEGAFTKRADWVLMRDLLDLDQEGYQRLVEKHEQFLECAYDIQAESTNRRAKSGEESVRVSNSQLCFVLKD